MRKIPEIKRDLSAKVREIDSLQGEERAAALVKIDELMRELQEAEILERANQALADRQLADMERAAGRRFSFVKFIREAMDGTLTGIEANAAEMGAEEMKRVGKPVYGYAIPSAVLRAAAGQNYTTPADGGNLTETGEIRYLEALKEKMVLSGLGATFLGNLIGTIPFVTDSNLTASWAAEASEVASVQKISFSKATMSPKRVCITGAFTKDLLMQTSIDVENLVQTKLVEAHAAAIEKAAISGSGTSGEPTGILNTTGIGAVEGGVNGAAISWKNIVALETAVNEKNGNAGRLGYLTNAKVIGALKTTEMSANNGRYLLDPLVSALNGYPIEWTNLVPSNLTKGTTEEAASAMIFGNWNDLYIGTWGGLDIVVDPYSKKKSAEVEITINAWNDVLVARKESFAAIKDITIG